jgi:hypothetical protein
MDLTKITSLPCCQTAGQNNYIFFQRTSINVLQKAILAASAGGRQMQWGQKSRRRELVQHLPYLALSGLLTASVERSKRSRCTNVSVFIIDKLTGKEIIPTMRGKS